MNWPAGKSLRQCLRRGSALSVIALSLTLASGGANGEGGGFRDERAASPNSWSGSGSVVRDSDSGKADPGRLAGEGAEPDAVYLRQMRIGDEAMARGNFEMAASFFQHAHAGNPEKSEPLLKLAMLFKQASKFEELAEIQQRLIRLEPDHLDYTVEYGLTLLRLGRTVDARVQLHGVLDLEETPRIYNALGVTYDMEGDHRSAQAYYRIALEQDLDYLAAMANLGLSLAISGDYPDSVQILSRLNAHPASEAEHRQILAAVHVMSGDVAAAQSVAGEDFNEATVDQTIQRYGLMPPKPQKDGI